MTKIPIHPHDDIFARLMRGAAKALRTGNAKLLESIKKELRRRRNQPLL